MHSLNTSRRTPRWWRRALVASRRANLFLLLEIASAALLLVMISISYLSFSAQPQAGQLLPSGQAAAMLVGTLIPALAIVVFLGRRIAIKRAGGTTARLHIRLVFFFSLVAAIPTLLVAVFASFLFQSGVEFWFSDSSRGILENANRLARGYYEENQRDVGNETVTMAGDLRFYLQQGSLASPDFAEGYSLQVVGRNLDESAILQLNGNDELRVVAIVDPDDNGEGQRVTRETIQQLQEGQTVVVKAGPERIEAVTAIDQDAGIYLYNARIADTLALSQWQRARSVLAAYDVMTQRATTLQLRFNLALFVASIALVGLAVWFALRFADRQVRPLTRLVGAARKVGSGNYALRIEGRTGHDEIGLLNRAFNRMTAQIEQQTKALVGANHQLDERRAFIEAVLESITAGILSVDPQGRITLINSSAKAVLNAENGADPIGCQLDDIAPELAALTASGRSHGIVQYNRNGELLTLAVKLSPASNGQVITFEDITRQLLNQRQAAWSDVARRIAHEIKNPLTPIQLATERLMRRYRKQIVQDGELFEELTSTIIRQVGDLRKMVDEFSSFARLPKPVFRQEDPVDLVRQAIFLQEVARPAINFRFEADGDIGLVLCDRHQFGQAMMNVLKNASEAVESRAKQDDIDFRGQVAVHVERSNDMLTVAITDNGVGLPQDGERIVEPYVTTREKGTGLGLAIVNKIVEEHGGEMSFVPVESGGARVIMRFACDPVGSDMANDMAEI
ncbi:ATP-binding protein [Altericroceibacterium endophyticum]|uniref:histidine kinase n=1 Tax=Altericroceibacterium endophyticum TaxID=1808508 RepID=A0A6I4T0R2_9SPHN|nr:ATP-binding protein [Altericroceibacterium endophyticum]MXO64527.1 HAMP domain-containing protein [Altericroceibacterium endophyticum]